MVIEQAKDKVLLNLKEGIQSSKASSSVLSKHIILDDILYYLSKLDTDPIIRLYLPRHIIKPIMMKYHDNNGHMGIDKHMMQSNTSTTGLICTRNSMTI